MALKRLCFIAGCMCIASCGGGENTRTTAEVRADLDLTWAAVVSEVGTPLADSIHQCAAIALGAKPCGGPSRYVVYSRQVSDEARLRMLAQRYTELEREWNAATDAISDCSLVVAPTVTLAGGQCR